MWTDLDWRDSKEELYSFFDGGIFGSEGICGSVVIRNNIVRDAFNGLRMKAASHIPRASQNLNVGIYANRFHLPRPQGE